MLKFIATIVQASYEGKKDALIFIEIYKYILTF
jgi:hypothetical protein